MEVGEKRGLLAAPAHAYTRSLIASHPSLPEEDMPAKAEKRQAPGAVPVVDIEKLHVRFATRRPVPARRG